ncbi:ATP-binding protein [Streptomyces sp. NPDC048483]|uniref:ATP-binding protein n=1 Tax=Streptomyces sp. NPDC048483 TaxID=3154927 RepID=UPI00342E6D01
MHHAPASPSATVPARSQGRVPARASALPPLPLPGPACRHAVIALPAEKRYVRTVRRFVLAQLNRWGVAEEDRDRIELIVGELAGNSARHGRAEMTVHLSLAGRNVCIDVLDTGRPTPPRPHSTTPRDECGRGLGIVSVLADWTDMRHPRHGWRARAGFRVGDQ